jgi:beta-aspartyl-peptidase (threonine type)
VTRNAWLLALAALLAACAPAPPDERSGPASAPAAAEEAPRWALAIHGGAGTISKDLPQAEGDAYTAGLRAALELGRSMLAGGRSSLDTVEQVVGLLEDDPRFNAGKGAVFNRDGEHELDASIMDGATLRCGAVAAVRQVKNPILAARAVMEGTPHVLLAGPAADAFAASRGLATVEQSYYFTERRHRELLEKRAREEAGGTVGVVALDLAGNLAAGTSTGGLTGKLPGRIGDSPIVGAGTYADNRTCAVSGTGIGEEFLRHAVAFQVSSLVLHAGMPLDQAARHVVHEVLRPGDGGLVAVGRNGTIAMEFNTSGMYRGAADSEGRFEIGIWE